MRFCYHAAVNLFVVGACCFPLLLETGEARAAETLRKPNVLFLLADDMRADSIAALGNPTVKTPNLDTLVRRGFTMRNAYCLGGNSGAVCTPSRNMLLSGNAYFRWKDFEPPNAPKQKGLLSPGDGPNFPLSMKAAGYSTYHHGKRGNTAPLIQAKFDVNKYLGNDEDERRSGEPGREIVDDAIEFLNQRSLRSDIVPPFCMYLAFGNPHDPRVAAKKYLDQYQRDLIPLPKNWLPVHPFDNGNMEIRDEKLLPWPRTEAALRQTHHEYYATITALDFHIGRLLETLKQQGQLDNTLIVFSADQGIAIGSHGLLGKQSLYDSAMKSPLVFAGPGIPQGESNALVYLLDIHPTLCDLVGTPVPSGIDGASFRPVLERKSKTARNELFFSYLNLQRAWRDDRFKLIRYPQVNVTQLFDLEADPDEMVDLSKEPAQADRIARMTAQLTKAQTHYGDSQPLTVANPKPATWTPSVQP
ncbi:MAG: sulfatase-like hydrolase/transferase [Candidatus Saccharimonas sp.]|nr:sulfatase-like hydrolase/transferase [Planctomycetaceae bacterium]